MTVRSIKCSALSPPGYANIKECCSNDDDCKNREYKWIFNTIYDNIKKYNDTEIAINCYPIKNSNGYCDLIICISIDSSYKKRCIPIECHSDKDGRKQRCNDEQIKQNIDNIIKRIGSFIDFVKNENSLRNISLIEQYDYLIYGIYSKCFDHRRQTKTASIKKCKDLIKECIKDSESFPGIIVNPYNGEKLNNNIPYHKLIKIILDYFFSVLKATSRVN